MMIILKCIAGLFIIHGVGEAVKTELNPFRRYSQVDSQVKGLPGTFVISRSGSLGHKLDDAVAQLFDEEDIYTRKTFKNEGVSYNSFCFHGALGTHAFDGINKRIIDGTDKFQKALVLTKTWDDAQNLRHRLRHQLIDSGNPNTEDMLKRIWAATSISDSAEEYQDQGLGASDEQILFYDISQLRKNLGVIKQLEEDAYKESEQALRSALDKTDASDQQKKTELKRYLPRLKKAFKVNSSLPIGEANTAIHSISGDEEFDAIANPLLDFNRKKREIISETVASLIEERNLSGTSQIYINSAEQFKSGYGYEILKELVKQLKVENKSDEMNLGAIANFDYRHGDDVDLASVFGKPTYLKLPAKFRSDALLPQVQPHLVKSLEKAETTNSTNMASVTTSQPFTKKMVEKIIQPRIVAGDKRIFVRAHSNLAMEALRSQMNKARENGSGISYGWVGEEIFLQGDKEKTYNYAYVDTNGVKHPVKDRNELMHHWGTNFNVLVHSKALDGIEEPADSAIIATKIKNNPDKLELLASPLFSLRTDSAETNHLFYYSFGKKTGGDYARKKEIKTMLGDIDQRHRFKGRETRSVSGKNISSGATNGTGVRPMEDDFETTVDEEWVALPEPIKHFWIRILFPSSNSLSFADFTGARRERKSLDKALAVYVKQVDADQKKETGRSIVGDSFLETREINYLRKKLNFVSTVDFSPALVHDKRKLIEFLFDYAGKSIKDYVHLYPSIIGIASLEEAQIRAQSVYKQYHNPVSKAGGIVDDMDFIGGDTHYNTKVKNRPNLIAEFLFNNGHVDLLTHQELNMNGTSFTNDTLERTIRVLTGIEVAETDSEQTLKADFDNFIHEKKAQEEKLRVDSKLGIDREAAGKLVEQYVENHEEDAIDLDQQSFLARLQVLGTALLNVEEVPDADSDTFYRFLAGKSKDGRQSSPACFTLADVIRINSDLINIQNENEAKYVTDELALPSPKGEVRADLRTWKSRFQSYDNASDVFAKYIFNNKPELLAIDQREQLTDLKSLIYGYRPALNTSEEDEFRDFLRFAFENDSALVKHVLNSKASSDLEANVSRVAKLSPGLTGVRNREELGYSLSVKVQSKFRSFCDKNSSLSKTKLSKLSQAEYQRLVLAFVSQFDLNDLAVSYGMTVQELNNLYFPNGIREIYQSSMNKVTNALDAEGIDTKDLKARWTDYWDSPGFNESVAKAVMAERFLKRPKDEVFGVDICAQDAESGLYFICSKLGVYAAKFISPELNSDEIVADRAGCLSKDWSAEAQSFAEDAEVKVLKKEDIWAAGIQENLTRVVDAKLDSQKRLRESGANIHEVHSIEELGALIAGRGSRTRDNQPTYTRAELVEAYQTIPNSITSVLGISKEELNDLFFEFLKSKFFFDRELDKKYKLPDLGTLFVAVNSGSYHEDAQALLTDFISFIGFVYEDQRVVPQIIKDIADNQSNYYATVGKSYSKLRDIAQDGASSQAALLAQTLFKDEYGLEIPNYEKLRLQCAEDIVKFDDLEKSEITPVVFAISPISTIIQGESHWEALAQKLFVTNLFDLDGDPEIGCDLGEDRILSISVKNAKTSNPEIKLQIKTDGEFYANQA